MAAIEVAFGILRDQPLDALEPIGREVDHHGSLVEQPFGVVRNYSVLRTPVELAGLLPEEYRLIRPRAGGQAGLGATRIKSGAKANRLSTISASHVADACSYQTLSGHSGRIYIDAQGCKRRRKNPSRVAA
jgi:hypothetical protein